MSEIFCLAISIRVGTSYENIRFLDVLRSTRTNSQSEIIPTGIVRDMKNNKRELVKIRPLVAPSRRQRESEIRWVPERNVIRLFKARDGDRGRPYLTGGRPREAGLRHVGEACCSPHAVLVSQFLDPASDSQQMYGCCRRRLQRSRKLPFRTVVRWSSEVLCFHSVVILKSTAGLSTDVAYMQHLSKVLEVSR